MFRAFLASILLALIALPLAPDVTMGRSLVNTVNSECRGHLYKTGGEKGFNDYLSCTRKGIYKQWQYGKGRIERADGMLAELARRKRLSHSRCVDFEEYERYQKAASKEAHRLQQQLLDVRTIANMIWSERHRDVSQAWVQGRLGSTMGYWASRVSRANEVDARRGLLDQAGKAADSMGYFKGNVMHTPGKPCGGGTPSGGDKPSPPPQNCRIERYPSGYSCVCDRGKPTKEICCSLPGATRRYKMIMCR